MVEFGEVESHPYEFRYLQMAERVGVDLFSRVWG